MKLHLCRENPCPEQEKECAAILENGFTLTHTSMTQDAQTGKAEWEEVFDEWLKEVPSITDCCNEWDIRAIRGFVSQAISRERQKVVEEVLKVMSEYMQDYANRPIEKRKNPYDEIWELKERVRKEMRE